MEILGKLFSSNGIVKIMRLFLLNPDTPYENKDLVLKCKVSSSGVRTEISILDSIGFIKKKSFFKEVKKKTKTKSSAKQKKVAKKRVSGWCLNPDFKYLDELKNLLVGSGSVNKKDILKRIKNTGKIKLIVLSGIFIKEDSSSTDILVVGDNIKKANLERALSTIESEIGKELNYSAMDTKDFDYRLGMYDKFIRDILDYPHDKLIDKIGL